MIERTKLVAQVIAAFAAGLALCIAAVLFVAGDGPSSLLTRAAPIGGPFSLTDENGRTFTDQDLKGKPFLLFFGFVRCGVVCPVTLFEMTEVLRALGNDSDRATAVLITLDPERDTPELLKQYVESFGPDVRGLTGTPAEIARLAKAYRVFYSKVPLGKDDYTIDHTVVVYLIDKQGRFVAPFNVKRTPEAAAADLRKFL